jgi:hypothetical protein
MRIFSGNRVTSLVCVQAKGIVSEFSRGQQLLSSSEGNLSAAEIDGQGLPAKEVETQKPVNAYIRW